MTLQSDRFHFLLLNIGHFLDHFFMLIFATVAALALHKQWDIGYGGLLAYATPGFMAFGLFSLPAGWIADRWSRDAMMCVFFVGIGGSALATGMATTPLQIGLGLFAIGAFAAIYHPVGLAIVTLKWRNTGMRIAVNGVWGNLGVAAAAAVTGFLIDVVGWRAAFVLPGLISIAIGAVYFAARRTAMKANAPLAEPSSGSGEEPGPRGILVRISAIVFFTTALTSVIFQSTTFALPKIFDERLQGLARNLAELADTFTGSLNTDLATAVGILAFFVFATASIAQLIVGSLLDRIGPRPVFMSVAAIQMIFFAVMPGKMDGMALAIALGFMLGAFGQIPINDYLIGRLARGKFRASAYGIRYVVAFSTLALSLPMIAYVHGRWGFDTLFTLLALTASILLIAVICLPRRLSRMLERGVVQPSPDPA